MTIRFLTRLSAVVAACLVLSACFHTQLQGSVGGSTLTIAPLRTPQHILATATSMTPSDLRAQWGEAKWNRQSSFNRLLFTGMVRFGQEFELPELDPTALYVVTASGGEDHDPASELSLSDSPATVQGSWHTITTGQRIMDGNLKVSALTEALYQQQLSHISTHSDAAIQSRLEAAAQLVVGDADENGTVDYDDVLRWNRSANEALFLGNIADLDALSQAIIAGQPDDMLLALAENVLGKHKVELTFDNGNVRVETYNWDSPITAANFIGYVRSGFYDQVLVHRAIKEFMIQIGALSYDGLNEEGKIAWSIKPSGTLIVNESSNGLSNLRGTLSMARTKNPDSASTQFFINQVDNTFLDYGSAQNPDGYAVFGRVYSGMTVVDEIASEPTTAISAAYTAVPARGVVLESARVLEAP